MRWILVLLLLESAAHAEELSGRVVSVENGNTITVEDAKKKPHKVRLSGVDAPEKAQPFGTQSEKHLSRLVYGKPVTVGYKKYDRYGRIVGKVMVAPPDACPAVQLECPKTLDAGLAQIAVGLAWHHKQYSDEQTPEERERYGFAEWDARARRAGLWADPKPVPPWEWRRAKRQER
jgi:endonuclease YncB( thermonuclease family)